MQDIEQKQYSENQIVDVQNNDLSRIYCKMQSLEIYYNSGYELSGLFILKNNNVLLIYQTDLVITKVYTYTKDNQYQEINHWDLQQEFMTPYGLLDDRFIVMFNPNSDSRKLKLFDYMEPQNSIHFHPNEFKFLLTRCNPDNFIDTIVISQRRMILFVFVNQNEDDDQRYVDIIRILLDEQDYNQIISVKNIFNSEKYGHQKFYKQYFESRKGKLLFTMNESKSVHIFDCFTQEIINISLESIFPSVQIKFYWIVFEEVRTNLYLMFIRYSDLEQIVIQQTKQYNTISLLFDQSLSKKDCLLVREVPLALNSDSSFINPIFIKIADQKDQIFFLYRYRTQIENIHIVEFNYFSNEIRIIGALSGISMLIIEPNLKLLFQGGVIVPDKEYDTTDRTNQVLLKGRIIKLTHKQIYYQAQLLKIINESHKDQSFYYKKELYLKAVEQLDGILLV